MHCHEGMHLLLAQGAFLASPKPTGRMTLLQDGSMHIFPCRQSLIGYVLAHDTPTALFMARQNIHIIINDISSCRSEGVPALPLSRDEERPGALFNDKLKKSYIKEVHR